MSTPPKRSDRGRRRGFGRLFGGDVGGDDVHLAERRQRGGRVCGAIFAEFGDDDLRTLTHEPLGVRVADAATGPGDDRDLALEPHVTAPLPLGRVLHAGEFDVVDVEPVTPGSESPAARTPARRDHRRCLGTTTRAQ